MDMGGDDAAVVELALVAERVSKITRANPDLKVLVEGDASNCVRARHRADGSIAESWCARCWADHAAAKPLIRGRCLSNS